MPSDQVHTITDYWDQPKRGIADYLGRPHVYERMFDDASDDWSKRYWLKPIDKETFALAMEAWAIWLRWLAIHPRGGGEGRHGVLPEDLPRREALDALLEPRLAIDPVTALIRVATFTFKGATNRDWTVEWSDVDPVERPSGDNPP